MRSDPDIAKYRNGIRNLSGNYLKLHTASAAALLLVGSLLFSRDFGYRRRNRLMLMTLRHSTFLSSPILLKGNNYLHCTTLLLVQDKTQRMVR